jgi:hypothetical protein
MKLLHIFYFISALCFGIGIVAQETSQLEHIKQLKEHIIACKILLKKAISESNPTKIGQLQAVIARLESNLENHHR